MICSEEIGGKALSGYVFGNPVDRAFGKPCDLPVRREAGARHTISEYLL